MTTSPSNDIHEHLAKEFTPQPINAKIGQLELVLRTVPVPADCNINGHVFGGWIMGQIDIAGAILAVRAAAGKTVTTVTFKDLTFKAPILVGDLISLYAQIIKIGNTSITIEILAYAWNHRNFDKTAELVAQATGIYVALDQHGKPTPFPQPSPTTTP